MTGLSVVPEPDGSPIQWMTTAEIAKRLRVSPRTIATWRTQGMPFHKRSGSVRFIVSEVDRWFLDGGSKVSA